MDPFEIKESLSTFRVIADTREQNTPRAKDRFEAFGVPVQRDELAMCFTRGRDRFRREFERATEASAKVWLLIEGGSWEAIDKHRYRSKFNEKALKASLIAWSIRYNMVPVFCKPETSGALIREILYRDIKERLENGTYEKK